MQNIKKYYLINAAGGVRTRVPNLYWVFSYSI